MFQKTVLLFFLFSYLLFGVSFVQAGSKGGSGAGVSSSNAEPVYLCDPMTGECDGKEHTDINVFIGTIINSILGLVGSAALAMFIYGGFLWLTSGGNMEQVRKGNDVLQWSVIGLIVIFSAYAIVSHLLKGITG